MSAPLFRPGIIACRNIPVVYLTIPKSGCTTIKNLLYRLDTGNVFTDPLAIHRTIRHGRVPGTFAAPDEDLDAFIRNRRLSFTFVRHPLARIYSCFNEKIYADSPYSFPRLRDQYLPTAYGLTLTDGSADYSPLQHSDNFKRFLLFVKDNIAGTTPVRQDAHWLPQMGLIRKYTAHLAIDLIGKLESYESDMGVVLDRIGMADRRELLTMKWNEGLPAPFPLEHILTAEIRELVEGIYAEDYLMLGYPASTPSH